MAKEKYVPVGDRPDVMITVPMEMGTKIMEVSIGDRVWQLKRGATVKVPWNVAEVVKQSVAITDGIDAYYKDWVGMKKLN